MDTIEIGTCKCGAYGQVFNAETEAALGMCHRDVLASTKPVGEPEVTCYDRDGNVIDCSADNISSVRIVEDVVMGTPTVSLCYPRRT